MRNCTYGWLLKRQGYVEVPESKYTERQKEMKEFIEKLSDVVIAAKCGWSGVKYKVMRDTTCSDYCIEKFMVLCVDEREVRWIPITGNSKGRNLQVLGENIW